MLPRPGLAEAVVDVDAGFVWMPPGVHLDPGAIGKGLAADLVCHELLLAGADGACVGIGGDVRVAGSPDDRDRWSITIDDPLDAGRELTRIDLADGGVATSSRLRRRWSRGGIELHHVVDPRTGRPVRHPAPWPCRSSPGRRGGPRSGRPRRCSRPTRSPGVATSTLLVVDEAGARRRPHRVRKVLTCSRP